jgi:hypothetical protein
VTTRKRKAPTMELWQAIQEASKKQRTWLSEGDARELAVAALNNMAETPAPGRLPANASKQMVLHPGEPIFVVRAKDNLSTAALRLLRTVYDIEDSVLDAFRRWRADHHSLLKDPD